MKKKGDAIISVSKKAARAGGDVAVAQCSLCSFHVSDPGSAQMLIGTNEAIGLGAIASGCKFYSAYPMTPSTGIMPYLSAKAKEYGIVVEQAEDEIAAINMALGASFAGVRAMTGMSGGGFALMTEGLSLAVALDCSFVAPGFAGDGSHLKDLIEQPVNHKGFALCDSLQPCVTFNTINTYDWYRQRVYRLGNDDNPLDRTRAFEKALEWGDRIPLGITYKNDRPTFEERVPVIKEKLLAGQEFSAPAMREKLELTLREYYSAFAKSDVYSLSRRNIDEYQGGAEDLLWRIRDRF